MADLAAPLGGGGNAACARGGDTSSRARAQPWQRPWGQDRTTPHGDRRLPGRRWSRSSSSCTRRSPAGRGLTASLVSGRRSGYSGTQCSRSLTLRLVCRFSMLLCRWWNSRFRGGAGEEGRGEDGPARGHDPRVGPGLAALGFGAKRIRKKRRKKKLPKASSSRRSCDHAAQVPAVLAAREREGASDSVHRQTLELPVAPQRQVRTVQTANWRFHSMRPSLCNDWCQVQITDVGTREGTVGVLGHD